MLALLLAVLLVAPGGTARCDAARRDAIRAAEAAWMREPEPLVFEVRSGMILSDGDSYADECGWRTSNDAPASWYECKARLARDREAARAKAQEERDARLAREDAAREAMFNVRDACGEGPKRPVPVKWEPLSAEESARLVIGGGK